MDEGARSGFDAAIRDLFERFNRELRYQPKLHGTVTLEIRLVQGKVKGYGGEVKDNYLWRGDDE